MKRKAVNLKHEHGTSVGRNTPLGNPFVISKWYNRQQVVYAHKLYMWQIIKHGKEPLHAINYVRKTLKLDGPDCMVLDLAPYFKTPTRNQFMSALEDIRSKPLLGCWCKPLACHADNYVRYLNWLDKSET